MNQRHHRGGRPNQSAPPPPHSRCSNRAATGSSEAGPINLVEDFRYFNWSVQPEPGQVWIGEVAGASFPFAEEWIRCHPEATLALSSWGGSAVKERLDRVLGPPTDSAYAYEPHAQDVLRVADHHRHGDCPVPGSGVVYLWEKWNASVRWPRVGVTQLPRLVVFLHVISVS
jgi:hypothetical protein